MAGNTTIDNLVLQYETRGESSFRNSLRGTGGAVGGLENQMSRLNLVQQAVIAGGGYKLIQYVKELGTTSLKTSGDMQVTEKALEKMLKNPANGKKLFGDILDAGKKNPLPLDDMTKMSKQLIAMRFHGDEVVPVMKALGSAVSVLGNDDGKFERIVYNLGQVRTQGKAFMRDIRQFNMAGLDVIGIMKNATGKDFTNEQLTEMNGEDFIRDFVKGINIQFGGMLDLVGNELPGQLVKLDNSFILLKKSVGDVFSSDASAFVGELTSITNTTADLIKKFPTLSKLIAGAVGTAGVATGGVFLLGTLAGAYKNLTSVVGGTTKAKSLLTTATKLDAAAESAKAIVAGKEGKAIGAVGNIANSVTGSKLKLAGAAEKEGLAAERAAGKLGLLGKAEKLAGNQVVSAVEVVGAEKAAGKLGLLGKVKPINAYEIPSFNTESEVAAIERITKAQKARIGVSKDLSRAMVDLDKKRGLANAAAMLDGTYETRLAAESEKVAKALNLQGEAGLKAANNLAKQNLASQGITEVSSFASPKTIKATEDLAKAEARVAKARQARVALGNIESGAQAEIIAARKLAATEIMIAEQTAARTSSIWAKAGRFTGNAGRAIGGKVAGIQSYLSEPVLGEAATGMRSVLPQAANRFEFLGMGRYRDTLTGQFAKRSAALEYNAAYGAESAASGGIRGALGGISNGQLLGGAALGAVAGVQSYDNWKAIGDSTGEAMAKASVTGIGAGLVSMFVPGGAIAVAAGEAIGAGINQFVNKPMEKAAVSDNPLGDTPETQGMTAQQKADYYKQKSKQDMASANATPWFLSPLAQGKFDRANEENRQSQLFAQQSRWEKARAKKKADADAQAAADAKRAADDRNNAIYNTINNGAAFYGGASQSRNGAWTITIPQSAADKSHRKIKANNNMTPNFL